MWGGFSGWRSGGGARAGRQRVDGASIRVGARGRVGCVLARTMGRGFTWETAGREVGAVVRASTHPTARYDRALRASFSLFSFSISAIRFTVGILNTVIVMSRSTESAKKIHKTPMEFVVAL